MVSVPLRLYPRTLLITLPPVVGGVLMYSADAAWLWGYYPLAIGVVLAAGMMIIRTYE